MEEVLEGNRKVGWKDAVITICSCYVAAEAAIACEGRLFESLLSGSFAASATAAVMSVAETDR